MEIDPKICIFVCVFLNLSVMSFQNLSIWPKTHPFFQFHTFCTPKRCTRVHCLVLKNNPNYVTFFYKDDIQLQIQVPPRSYCHNKQIDGKNSEQQQKYKTHERNIFVFLVLQLLLGAWNVQKLPALQYLAQIWTLQLSSLIYVLHVFCKVIISPSNIKKQIENIKKKQKKKTKPVFKTVQDWLKQIR